MNYRRIETAREVRLWIERIIFPTLVSTGAVIVNPKLRDRVKKIFEKKHDKEVIIDDYN